MPYKFKLEFDVSGNVNEDSMKKDFEILRQLIENGKSYSRILSALEGKAKQDKKRLPLSESKPFNDIVNPSKKLETSMNLLKQLVDLRRELIILGQIAAELSDPKNDGKIREFIDRWNKVKVMLGVATIPAISFKQPITENNAKQLAARLIKPGSAEDEDKLSQYDKLMEKISSKIQAIDFNADIEKYDAADKALQSAMFAKDPVLSIFISGDVAAKLSEPIKSRKSIGGGLLQLKAMATQRFSSADTKLKEGVALGAFMKPLQDAISAYQAQFILQYTNDPVPLSTLKSDVLVCDQLAALKEQIKQSYGYVQGGGITSPSIKAKAITLLEGMANNLKLDLKEVPISTRPRSGSH